MLLVNTFDVEPWWSTVPPCVATAAWGSMPDRSETPLREYLDLCDEAGVKCTFFFIGWYAKRFPQRVKEVIARGHEVGCHSLYHEDVSTLTNEEFRETTRIAKSSIEDATGEAVIAYRAPSFSFPQDRCAELFGVLSELGFLIDSSICTAGRVYGGGFTREEFPGPMTLRDTFGVDLFEVPVPGVSFAGREIQLFGGGYLRLAPGFMLDHFMKREKYQVLYLHPHDFDEDVPDLPNVNTVKNLRLRLRIGSLRKKVLSLFAKSDVRSCGQLISNTQIAYDRI